MTDKRINPLIGAFRTDASGAPPDKLEEKQGAAEPVIGAKGSSPPTAASVTPSVKLPEDKSPPKVPKAGDGKPAAAVPGKPDEEKKPDAHPKDAEAEKPVTDSTNPGKSGGEKKLPEPSKENKEDKPVSTSTAPSKSDEVKKTDEPPKGTKVETPTASPTTQTKPGEKNKPPELPKENNEDKPTPTSTVPGKPDEGKTPSDTLKDAKNGNSAAGPVPSASPTENGETPSGKRTAEGPKGSAVTKVFSDRLDAPSAGDMLTLPIPKEGEVFGMAVHPAYLRDFLDHPFTINRETQDYKDLYESIKTYGIQEPVKCRPGRKGGLEIISGHRRHDIGAQLNYPIPVIIEQIDDDDAEIQCVDGNLHRRDIPISELARAAEMKVAALRRKTGRRSNAEKAAGSGPQKRSDELVGEDLGMSRASVQRLMRVNKLEEPLKKMVDKKELPLDTAEQISHMKPEHQRQLADAIEKEGGTVPSKTEAVKLKEESKAGTLTPQKIEKSVAPTKRELNPPLKITLTEEELKPYMPEKATVPDAKRIVLEALALWKEAKTLQKQRAANAAKGPSAPQTPKASKGAKTGAAR